MKIEQCSIVIKCDVDGCHNKAKKSISFDGVTTQYYLCDDCLKKLYQTLKNEYGKEESYGKGQKK